MSSPISSLKKNKRSPLHSPSKSSGQRMPPFRHPDFTEDQIQSVTDNAQQVRFLKGVKPFRKPENNLNFLEDLDNPSLPAQRNTSNEHEFVALLMSRLVQVETKLSEAQNVIYEKDEKIAFLEEKLKIYENMHGNSTNSNDLEQQCLLYQQQIHEMEHFLNDYGMIWVGEKKNSSGNVSVSSGKASDITTSDTSEEREKTDSVWKPDFSVVPDPGKKFEIDFDAIIENIKELNIIAGEGCSQVNVANNGGQLKAVEPIPLTLFANGIVMFEGPFRSYSDPVTQQCLQDLMDGFYPSELQMLYPNGVPFMLTDKRFVIFKPVQLPFLGEGKTVTGRNLYSEELSFIYKCGYKDKIRRSIKKLPEVVIRHGQILTLSEPAAEKNKIMLVPTHNFEKVGKNSKQKNTVSLRIRSENGDEYYLLKLFTSDTIGDVRKYIDSFRKLPVKDYEIVCVHPRQVFKDDNKTLAQCDLIHNMTLNLCSSVV